MKSLPKIVAVNLAVVAICGASTAFADQASDTIGAPLPFAAYDRDGNGSISEQEFDDRQAEQERDRVAAGAPMGGAVNTTTFAEFDRNSDGQVTAAEFSEVRSAMPMVSPGSGMGLSAGEGPRPGFSDLDVNGDGIISAAEFNTARANRAVERSQQGAPLGAMRNAPTLPELDLNGDGQLSPDEFAAAQARYPDQYRAQIPVQH